jgi:non-specific serine/threonine protein kinase
VFQGDFPRAEALIEQSLTLWRGLGDEEQEAVNLIRLGLAFMDQERYAEAAARTAEAFAMLEELGDTAVLAAPYASIALNNLGAITISQGDYARAADYLAAALARQRTMGYSWATGYTLVDLGRLARLQGDSVEAAARFQESLELARTHGDPWMAARALLGLATIALAGGQPERSARLLGAKTALDDLIGGSIHPYERADQERALASLRTQLGEPAFAAAFAEGRAVDLDEAIRLGEGALAAPPPAGGAGRTRPGGLTEREVEILALLARGGSSQEIASALSISARTVERHIGNIYLKVGAHNRAEATTYAFRQGIVPSS